MSISQTDKHINIIVRNLTIDLIVNHVLIKKVINSFYSLNVLDTDTSHNIYTFIPQNKKSLIRYNRGC